MNAAPAARPPRLHRPDSSPALPVRRRASWHQRIIEAEGGLRLGLRADSTLHLHLFIASAVAVTGVIVGLSFTDWLLLTIAFAATMGAELFHQALRTLVQELGAASLPSTRRALRLSTAAALTVVAGSSLVAAGVLARRLWQLFN
jgi:diacylglycerol kinase